MASKIPRHNLHARTVHFGYGHIIPLQSLSRGDVRSIEEKLENEKGFEILGNNIRGGELAETKVALQNSEYILKIQRVGEIKSGAAEPLYAIVGLVQANSHPERLHEIYKMILDAVKKTMGISNTVIQKEATIKTLYGPLPKDEAAFKYLWEDVLSQKRDTLEIFGQGGIAGGGLRIVTAPKSVDELEGEPLQTTYKIESFLQDSRYIYSEIKYEWKQPRIYEDLEGILSSAEKNIKYALRDGKENVEKYLTGGN